MIEIGGSGEPEMADVRDGTSTAFVSNLLNAALRYVRKIDSRSVHFMYALLWLFLDINHTC